MLHKSLMYNLTQFWYNIFANVFGGNGVIYMITKNKQLTLSQRIKIEEINSVPRESLGNKTPYEVFTFIYGKEVADKLNIQKIEKDEVTTTPHLFQNN